MPVTFRWFYCLVAKFTSWVSSVCSPTGWWQHDVRINSFSGVIYLNITSPQAKFVKKTAKTSQKWHLGFQHPPDPTEGEEEDEMFLWVVCHLSPFLLSTGGQIDAGRSRRTSAGRQAGRERDGCFRKAVSSAWATMPLSWLGLVNQASPPGPIFHPQTFTTACSAACDERGCCHRSYRSCGMSLSDWGISPIWAWSLKCPILSRCLSAGYMFCRMPSRYQLLSAPCIT